MQKARTRLGVSAYSQPPALPAMPAGLVELMEGLSREVLRHNPTDVHQFCADHMKRLLDVRDAHEGKPAAKPLPLEKKIAKAQEKVRHRAEQRRKKYDELIEQVILENNQVEEKEKNETEKPTATIENGAIVLQHVVDAVSGPNSEDNVVTTDDSAEKREGKIIPLIKENESNETNEINNMALEAENVDNSAIDKDVSKADEAVDIKVVESETKEAIAITKRASSEDCVATISKRCQDNEVIAESTYSTPIFEEVIEEKKISVLQDSGNVKEDTSSEHQSAGTIEMAVIEPHENENEIRDQNHDDKNKILSENTKDNKNDLIKLVVEDDGVESMSEPVSVDPANDLTATTNEKVYQESQDNVPTTNENVKETLPNLKSSEDLSKENEKVCDVISFEKEALDKHHEEISDDKKYVDDTAEESPKEALNNDNDDMVKPEILEIGDVLEPPAVNKAEDEITQLKKAPEVLDEIQLKENEVILISSASTGGDKTNTVPENISTDTEEEANDAHSPQHGDEGTNSIDKENSTDRLDIDINFIAKSDSTNDMITEESNDSNSGCMPTNGVGDSLNKSPRSAPTMDLETAAVTIQKVFRNFLFKSRASTLDDVSIDDGSVEAAYPPDDILSDQDGNVLHAEEQYHAPNIKERRTLGITRMDTVLQTVNEEKSLSLSTDESSLSSAATIIQAHVRGFLVRNKLISNKTNSLVNSDGHPSFDVDNEQQKNKTVLNIHIVPEGGHYMSRDESTAMSLDLPYDSPTSSTNLHPFSYDTAERRKQLKREDAIQSISPPSTNSGKLSEDIDSVKELSIHDAASTPSTAVVADDTTNDDDKNNLETPKEIVLTSGDTTPTKSVTGDTIIENVEAKESPKPEDSHRSVTELTLDETDVVMAVSPRGLRHSGEFHDAPLPLPTSVWRADSTVAREFKTVLSYLLIWNTSS